MKRETGANPVRSRHCDRGVYDRVPGGRLLLTRGPISQETCRYLERERMLQATRNWSVRVGDDRQFWNPFPVGKGFFAVMEALRRFQIFEKE